MENQDDTCSEIISSIDKLEHTIYDGCKRTQDYKRLLSLFEIPNLTNDDIIQNGKLWAGMMTQK